MVTQQTTEQILRGSVRLLKPELLAQIPDDYNRRQAFNFLRHNATNYDVLLDQQRQRYGIVTPAENKAAVQGAADVIIQALRDENIELIQGRSNTPFARFARSIAELLGLDSGVDLAMIHEATKTLKRSQVMYSSWNERYRRQRDLVLKAIESASPEVRQQVREIYKATSGAKLDALEKRFNG